LKVACAAGGCVIRWKGRDYPMMQPELIDTSAAAQATFNVFERVVMNRFQINHCLRLRHGHQKRELGGRKG
jgi:hypothetical protein